MASLVCGCSLAIGGDTEEGRPCRVGADGVTRFCLPGFHCENDICVPGEIPDAGPQCGPGEREKDGVCVDVCEVTICATGDACVPGTGCRDVAAGLGALCATDDDCAEVVPGCSTDSTRVADVYCACLTTTARSGPGIQEPGICAAMPADPTDCEVCGEAPCRQVEFQSVNAGRPGERAVCVPLGFAGCDTSADCASEEATLTCAFFGWLSDPAIAPAPSVPLGLTRACVTAAVDTGNDFGTPCDPANPLTCATGTCVRFEGGRHACSGPCVGDTDCVDPSLDCIFAPVELGPGPVPFSDVVPACGVGGSLSSACDASASPSSWPCATDAPTCGGTPSKCTRRCANNADCVSGTSCQRGTGLCL